LRRSCTLPRRYWRRSHNDHVSLRVMVRAKKEEEPLARHGAVAHTPPHEAVPRNPGSPPPSLPLQTPRLSDQEPRKNWRDGQNPVPCLHHPLVVGGGLQGSTTIREGASRLSLTHPAPFQPFLQKPACEGSLSLVATRLGRGDSRAVNGGPAPGWPPGLPGVERMCRR